MSKSHVKSVAPANKKSPDPTDRHIGARVRLRRQMLSMSQEKLGDALGLTFQQVQKYEKGANRIGGSRMQQICTVLQVPVSFFYEGLADPRKGDEAADADRTFSEFITDPLAHRLIAGFVGVDEATRKAITDHVEALAAANGKGAKTKLRAVA